MKPRLKKVSDQVIVITGASSGIGLATARLAAKRGARLVLAARSGDALQLLVNEINQAGGEAIHVVADVGNRDDVREIATAAKAKFGGFDTWVNDAGVSVYGKLTEIRDEDIHRLFDTNFWGVVNGSLEAVETLRQRGGALINIGSAVSERAIPLQGAYGASKHAIKGFTDALRVELEYEGAPVSVTLIKPASIDTPFVHHAKNYMEVEPSLPPPVYDPETVARAILHCAQKPTRSLFVGGGGKTISLLGTLVPGLADKLMERTFIKQQKSGYPPRPLDENNLYAPAGTLEERGGYRGHIMRSSLYTSASLHPVLTGAFVAATAWIGFSSLFSNAER